MAYLKGKNTFKYLIAASNATTREKLLADYVCSGTNDGTAINTQKATVLSQGGFLEFSSGTFAIDTPITFGRHY